MLSKQAQKTLRGWEAHGERIIMASFTTQNKKINLNIILIYAPTNDATEEDKEVFYNRLQEIIDKLPQKDVNVLMGDSNAKIGSCNKGYETVMGRQGLGIMNDNGGKFADLCALNSLVIGGSIFTHKRIHKATWVSPDGITENQIDHFCITRKFRHSLEDVRAVRGADIGSDHYLLLAKVKLHLKSYRNTTAVKRTKFQVELLQEKKEQFQLTLKNRFDALQDLVNDETDIETHWSKTKEALVSTCTEVLGERKREKKEWISKRSMDLIEKRKKKKEEINNSKTIFAKETAQGEYKTAAREVKRSLKRDKEEHINNLAEKAEKAAVEGHMNIVYQITKTLSGKHGRTEVPVKDKDGKTIFGKEDQAKRWVEHFNSLLNRPPPNNPPDILPAGNDLPINCNAPTRIEIIAEMNKLD